MKFQPCQTEHKQYIFDLIFSVHQPHHGSKDYSASNSNHYQKISGGKAQPACKAENLTAIYEPTV
jgi:hypothetical protein